MFEISDSSYSVQCTFTPESLKSLKHALTGFTSEINLLGIVGKRLSVESASVIDKKLSVGAFKIVPDLKWDS